MGTQTEIAEIEILTEEQIAALPESVHDNVVYLTENVRPKELVVLNPLVASLLNMQNDLAALKPEKNEKGEFTKESIEAYKALKATQRSFNGALTKTAKNLKKPYQDINKGFIAIENEFKKLSDEIKKEAEAKFAEYEEQLAEKRRIAQEKKDAEMNKKIEEANAQAEFIRAQQEKTEVYNKVMYLEIGGNLRDRAITAIDTLSIDGISRLKAEIAQKVFEDVLPENHEVLDAEVKKELEEAFYERKAWAIQKMDEKIESHEEELRKQAQAMAAEVAPPPAPHFTAAAPEAPKPFLVEFTDAEFCGEIVDEVRRLRKEVVARINNQAVSQEVHTLLIKLDNFLNQ